MILNVIFLVFLFITIIYLWFLQKTNFYEFSIYSVKLEKNINFYLLCFYIIAFFILGVLTMLEWSIILAADLLYDALAKQQATLAEVKAGGHIVLGGENEVTSNTKNDGLPKKHPTFIVVKEKVPGALNTGNEKTFDQKNSEINSPKKHPIL